MYERMKMRINNVVGRGSIDEYVTEEESHRAFTIWRSIPDLTLPNYPNIVHVFSVKFIS